MYKKKSLFVTFEGIEGSGKSYQAYKLYKKLKNNECHVGWNIVTPKNNKSLQQKAGFYFNHSFYVECLPKYIQGISKYQNNFATMVKSKNFYGLQFHPEKSQNAGIHILKNIIGD